MFSVTTRHGINALVTLAALPQERFVTVKELSVITGIPGPYLSKVMKSLVAHRLLESKRGLQGGVRLQVMATDISLFDICAALEDPIVSGACISGRQSCGEGAPCALHARWAAAREPLMTFLKQTKIAPADSHQREQSR